MNQCDGTPTLAAGVTPLAGQPLTGDQAIALWHANIGTHGRESAFEWFVAGILSAEAHHGISTPAAPGEGERP